MKILIKGGHVVDPVSGLDGLYDVLIDGKKIKSVTAAKKKKTPSNKTSSAKESSGLRIMDASGMYVIPGLMDLHVHLREPGFEYKETIASGTLAAVKGGFTGVCAMPNTMPVNDNAGITEYILQKAQKEGACRVFPVGAITKGQKGEELTEMGMMKEAGCVAFSDDGRPVMSSSVMRRALEYSKAFRVPIISHSEDLNLSDGGVMNEGTLSYSLGLKGMPAAAEETMVFRDIAIAELTGGKLHIAHVSTEGSVRLIRNAKIRGVNVTAETCPHYFSISEEAVIGYNTDAKVNPPLRNQKDIDAVKEGLIDGTIDVIATDHAPHSANEKLREFDLAPSGISGLETALPLSLALVREGVLTFKRLVEKMTVIPSDIIGMRKRPIAAGEDADIVVVNMKKKKKIDPREFISKGKNTPFKGMEMTGFPAYTIHRGKVYEWQ